ncbi:hypothetical protein FHS43_003750 [Streptosporangium becharense]|uniref:Fungal lipase-like domain-containing protein n=1 Tax=Streptosporangium becharense TaxID=1816182 RepID=A0A7W9IIE0_9ACTN|nr:hypothetical protein [Streptosporangium becharense]MBB2912467.1 hypothetical protein [Streptosporangium becharense]MBB5820703.1 hypothetical protein [Streptosporangium becharense]
MSGQNDPAGGAVSGTAGSAAGPLRAAARELADIGVAIQEAAAHATAALTDGALLRALPHAPVAGHPAYRALLRAVTNREGLGYALVGGRLGTLAAKLGAMAGAESLAVRVLAVSLRLRIAAVAVDHPELTGDPMLGRLIAAAAADRDLEAVRALRALLKDRGAVRALSQLAPIFGEVLALRALLDENPLNDAAAWLIATGKGYATADPVTGISNRAVAALDTGEGAAHRVDLVAAESARLSLRGSLLGFLRNISVVGTTGRILIQSVEGPDGVVRHVVQAPGMRAGRPDGDSPQDLLGAFSSAVLASSPYSRALARAIDDYGLPPGAELALVGHSAGGAAVMNLAQDPRFCDRHTVTHVVAVGSPVDFKRPADPRTWVAGVTNQHDIIPTLDGQGAGNCFDLHPGWYVVDYHDPTHLFPLCHGVEHYIANLADDLVEARERIDERLTPYRGPVVRSQAYLLFDRAPGPEGFPFLTVPTYPVDGPGGTIELPVRCQDGSAITAYFAADPVAAAGLLEETGSGPAVRIAGRALVAVHASWNRRTSVGGYREIHVGVVVPDPWRPRSPRVWADLPRGADRRRSGTLLAGSVVDTAAVSALAPLLWGREAYPAPMEFGLTAGAARVAVGPPDDRLLVLRGFLGPGLPVSDRDLVGYARGPAGTMLRSCVRTRGLGRLHPAPRVRLAVEPRSAHPLARLLRELGLDGARPLLCLSAVTRRALQGAAVAVPPT